MSGDDPRVQRAREAAETPIPAVMNPAKVQDAIRDLLAVVDEQQAKIDMLDPDGTLCTTCGCTNRAWNNECPCPDHDCGCWAHRQEDRP